MDVIISVDYRVKSKRGVAFRKWANRVLKQYILEGYAVNQNRMSQLGSAIRLMRRIDNDLDAKQVLSVVESFDEALTIMIVEPRPDEKEMMVSVVMNCVG